MTTAEKKDWVDRAADDLTAHQIFLGDLVSHVHEFADLVFSYEYSPTEQSRMDLPTGEEGTNTPIGRFGLASVADAAHAGEIASVTIARHGKDGRVLVFRLSFTDADGQRNWIMLPAAYMRYPEAYEAVYSEHFRQTRGRALAYRAVKVLKAHDEANKAYDNVVEQLLPIIQAYADSSGQETLTEGELEHVAVEQDREPDRLAVLTAWFDYFGKPASIEVPLEYVHAWRGEVGE